jgi:hypothetical protein
LISNKFWVGGGGRWEAGWGEARGPSRRGRIKGVEGWRGGGVGVGGGRSRVIKLLYAPERPEQCDWLFYAPVPPPPTVWALKPPSWALHLLGLSLANICVCTRRYAGINT